MKCSFKPVMNYGFNIQSRGHFIQRMYISSENKPATDDQQLTKQTLRKTFADRNLQRTIFLEAFSVQTWQSVSKIIAEH